MTDAAIEARREYHRKWARENRDKVKAHQEKYWNKRAAEAAAAAAKDPAPQPQAEPARDEYLTDYLDAFVK